MQSRCCPTPMKLWLISVISILSLLFGFLGDVLKRQPDLQRHHLRIAGGFDQSSDSEFSNRYRTVTGFLRPRAVLSPDQGCDFQLSLRHTPPGRDSGEFSQIITIRNRWILGQNSSHGFSVSTGLIRVSCFLKVCLRCCDSVLVSLPVCPMRSRR